MNEKDPNGNLPQSPLLSPDTLTPKSVEPPKPSNDVEPPKEQKNTKTKILIGSIAALLIVGTATVAVLAKTGAFSKGGKENAEELVESSSSQTAPESTETTETSAAGSTTASTEPHELVDSLSQISDDQVKLMDETSRDFIRSDASFFGDCIPDEVSIDEMNYLGMLLQEVYYAYPDGSTSRDIAVQMVYQVQLTDNTGDEPVARQFFWMCGFSNVYQDGTIDPARTIPMGGTVCFDNWSTHGYLDLDILFYEAERSYSTDENGVDKSLVLPFEGDTGEKHPLVTSLDQISDAMKDTFIKECDNILATSDLPYWLSSEGYVMNNAEFAGLGLTVSTNKTVNSVYVFYKIDITDLNQSSPVDQSFYWFASFHGIYQGGQIQTQTFSGLTFYTDELSEWIDSTSTVEDLRKFIKHNESVGCSYEDTFEEEYPWESE